MDISFKTIGIIHTPFQTAKETPIQAIRSDAVGQVEVNLDYLEGLDGVEEFSHLILLYIFDRSPKEISLKVKPFLDDQVHGVFATRYPQRPNPIGISVVELISREGNVLTIRGADMLDGTPLLDIKPYIPDFDVHKTLNNGWFDHRANP
jgi:tRNA (adenine37-N6)-methyltransferase